MRKKFNFQLLNNKTKTKKYNEKISNENKKKEGQNDLLYIIY
jgi:hypothetical protein